MLCDDSQPSGKSPRPGKGGPALPFSWYLAIPPWLPGGKILAMPYHLSCGSSSLKASHSISRLVYLFQEIMSKCAKLFQERMDHVYVLDILLRWTKCVQCFGARKLKFKLK